MLLKSVLALRVLKLMRFPTNFLEIGCFRGEMCAGMCIQAGLKSLPL